MTKSILEVFIKTADAGSFEKASKQLFISSTALIKQIKRLEQETSLTLFHRTNRGISLTTSGKIFYDASVKIISDYKTAIQTAQNLERKHPETLRFGISMINPYINTTDYISYETKFHAKYNLAIVPIECNYNAFLEQFKNIGQTIDVIPYILDNKDLDLICNSFHIANFPLRIAVPFKHPLIKKEKLSYSDLENETIITLNGDLNIHYQNAIQEITEHISSVKFQSTNFFDFNLFDYAIKNNHLILVGDYLKNVHPSLTLLPVNWDFTIPYGLYYSKTPSTLVSKCIESFSEIKLNDFNDNVFLCEF